MRLGLVLGVAVLALGGCVQSQAPTDPGDSGLPLASSAAVPSVASPQPGLSPAPGATPSPATTQALAYTPDLEPIFRNDCVPCHSGNRPDGNYSMTSYANTMRAVSAGNANSRLVTTTQLRGSMYRYFTGNRNAKADLVRRWVVDSKAAQTR